VAKDVDADVAKVGATSRPRNETLNETLGQGSAVHRTEHLLASQVPMFAQSGG